jgi:AAA family ATPase
MIIIATCLDPITDVPYELRKFGRFSDSLYLSLPDVQCRREILSSLDLPIALESKDETLQHLSERTHAYNINDLRQLVSLTMKKWRHANATPSEPQSEPAIPLEMFTRALKEIRPTAMHDINVKPPPIQWDDICGQDGVKEELRLALYMTTASLDDLGRFNLSRLKGVLLYGPPGCSKTMAAQALAATSGFNFFAIKAAQLVNMYVGETERAIRQLFQRARDLAPSILFFDEFDSIGGQRSGFGSSNNGGSGGPGHSGLNVVTTFLTEMDGFEALEGVLVLAATNRPQTLDPALLRPGRFDKIIYVGPPDRAAREAIFRQGTSRSRLQDGDIAALADATDGYSGAEIKAICVMAGTAALRRAGVGKLGGTAALDAGEDQGVTVDDLKKAITWQRKQITADMLKSYHDWEELFRKY